MAAFDRWYFEEEQIHNTPSIKCGFDHDKELSCRQHAANFIQDMGIRLQVNQLCINTAIVYMHRFYMFHSFTRFHRTSLASAALFLAAKVEEQPRKLEHVIRFAQLCLHRGEQQVPFDVNSQPYAEQVQDLIMNENILLQTLGFDVAIDHPHTHIVRFCQLVNASKELAQTSYFMASYSLHLTTMSLQYKPTVVACFCIHLACKWSNWEIPDSSEGKPWFWYVDKSVTSELLEKLTAAFLILFEKCPSRLKRKITALSAYSNIPPGIANQQPGQPQSQQELDKRKENKQTVDSHNPLNTVPHPIGALGAAVADANAHNSSSSYIHHNPIVGRHGNAEELMKKRPYEHGQRLSSVQASLPPPILPEPPYKKHHHTSSHHQRESHSMSLASSSNKPSCMFDVVPQVQPPPIHKSSYPHPLASGGHAVAPQCNTNNTSNRAAVSLPHRPPSSRPLHVRNGEAHFQEKKYSEMKRNNMETKAPPMLGPPSQMPVRSRAKTPPHSINLIPQSLAQPHFKVERSIFSPEEKTESPPPILRIQEKVIKNSPPPTPKTPIEIKREADSPGIEQQIHSQSYFSAQRVSVDVKKEINSPEVEQVIMQTVSQASSYCPTTRITVENKKEVPSPETIQNQPLQSAQTLSPQPNIPPSHPDTPSSKSSHKKKKKKHKDHKDKHKVKHKHKHKIKDPEPIVITIPKDKITISHPEGLKIKIAKEKISHPSSGLKLKISKDKLKESKKRERSDPEEDEVEHPSKQHRPNGTTALQVTQSNNPFSCVLGKSLLSPIRTPAHFIHKTPKCDSSDDSSPSSSPTIDRGKPVSDVVTSRFDPDSSLEPIPVTVKTPGHSPSNNNNNNINKTGPDEVPRYNHSPTKPCLSPLAATPRHGSPKHHRVPSPPISHSIRSAVTELPNVSPVQSKPFLSPIAATPRRNSKPRAPKIPPFPHSSISLNDLSHMSPIHSKPILSPIAPTPRYPSPPKKSLSPPPKHVYVPLVSITTTHSNSSSPSSPSLSDCDAHSKKCVSPLPNTTSTLLDNNVTTPNRSPILIPHNSSPSYDSFKKDQFSCKNLENQKQASLCADMSHFVDEFDKGSCYKYDSHKTNINYEDKLDSITIPDASVHNVDHSNITDEINCSIIPSPRLTDVQMSTHHNHLTNFEPFNKNKILLSPIMTPSHNMECNKCLSPIMTPGRSPICVDRGRVKSPSMDSRYSNSPPDVSSHTRDQSPESRVVYKGPRTPPGPSSPPSFQTASYIYNPITPLRPDPNEIIFKDSNDNHTKPPYHKRQVPERRHGDDKHRKPPLLPDFKIPRVSGGHSRRMPGPQDTANCWGMRGRGRINHGPGPGYSRGRGCSGLGRSRGRWEPPQYRHRPLMHHNDARHNAAAAYHMQHMYDPSSVLQGNAYDSAIMKHAYESMAMHADGMQYYMTPYPPQQQLYVPVPSYPPPPPLPQEPPPPQPPPPPP